jgi:hypothetical protein
MPLPKIAVPQYDMKLPVTGSVIKYRPFLVKEEKILLMAMESQNEKEIISAMKTIIRNCTTLRNKVEDLPTFEIEYIFLKIRSRSVGEVSKIMITCPDDGETQVETEVDLNEIKVSIPKNHDRNIMLTDTIGLVMKYPSLDMFVKDNFNLQNVTAETAFDMTADCIESVFEGEEVTEDASKKELLEFLDNLSNQQFAKIQNFFDTMPKLSHKIKVKNPNTDVESEVVIEGLAAFFE